MLQQQRVEPPAGTAASGRDELGNGGGGGVNRWPREEALALLQIRSDMDAVFRDSSHKVPLWDEVSRKLAEMGYRRSSKKCREKFENLYKYHRRTKDSRSGDGKTYRFFDQLEALEANHPSSSALLPEAAVPIAMAMPHPPPPLTTTKQPVITPANQPAPVRPAPAPSLQNANWNNTMNFTDSPSSSSDEEIMRSRRSRRKRKWKDFFNKLTKDMVTKQEQLERKFLDAMERKENELKVQEQSWRITEIARLRQEREILLQERSMASAKEAALISYLQSLSDNHQFSLPLAILQPQPPPQPSSPTFSAQFPILVIPISKPQENTVTVKPAAAPEPVPAPVQMQDNGVLSPSRRPKEEIEALIKLRVSMEHKFQQEGNGKMLLWEEIAGSMRTMGYNRNAKRCKEKWENINKYYRKVKESNKKPRVDSKTCPYYYQLEALYGGKSTNSSSADDGEEDYDDDDEEGGYEIAGNTNSFHGGDGGFERERSVK